MFQLLRNRSFSALTITQFLGAFNDNVFKQLVLLLAVSVGVGSLPEWVSESRWAQWDIMPLQAVVGLAFALPFVAFGAITGSLADRVSKSRVIKAANLMEIAVMGVALLAFTAKSYDLLLATVFLMGTQSAIFGPSKYGSIQEIVGKTGLSRGNALIQTTTMAAILIGIMLAGTFRKEFSDALWIPGVFLVGFAIVGWLASLRIDRLEPADPTRAIHWNAFAEFRRHWKATEGNRPLILCIFASSFFYLVGALLLFVVNEYGAHLGLEADETSMLNGMTVIGIAVGAVLAGKISGDRIEGGLVPIGLLGMGLSLVAVRIAPGSTDLVRISMFSTGVFAGLFTIPIRALIQSLPRDDKRGAILGLSEVMDFVGILLANFVYTLLEDGLELAPPDMFVVIGVAVLVFMVGSLLYTAEFAVRVFLMVLVHTLYRLRVRGEHNIPREGGALLVSNHISFIDPILIGAASPRPVRFLMYRDFFDLPLVGWFAAKMGAIPVSNRDSRRDKVQSIQAAAEMASKGELVCIFAEGAITRTGGMLPFARGMEKIARRAGVPIVPVALDQLWGSIFSFEGGKVFWKRPQRLPYPVDVLVGEALPPGTSAPEVRNVIQEQIAESRIARDGRRGSLAWRFLKNSKLYARETAVVDSTGARMKYKDLLRATLAMERALGRRIGASPRVGVLLPPGAAGAIVNVSLALAGRASVNLNYTMSNEALAGPISTAGVEHVVTSRRFLKALKRESPVPESGTIFVEDLAKEIRTADKVRALLLGFLPGGLLARWLSPQRSASETATVIFSSGSTGEPKGVELSHSNVLSNVQGIHQVLSIGPGDGLVGVLPFFHSFGYTVTLWATLLGGGKAIYHSNPLDAKTIGELCKAESGTILVATPTFYQSYLRRIPAEELSTLRIAMCGAERLRESLATAWEEKFGLPLMEGYGCTELSPVVSFNVPDVEVLGERQPGHKPGTIGRPLPGVAIRIVDPDTGEPLPTDTAGLLLVKGPNVMKGYLGRPEATAEVLKDGWYSTGDIALVDKDGFLVVTDRLSRFSKIGGEMVPHGRVEDALTGIVRSLHVIEPAPEIAVTAVPDEQKGEQLVVLHTALAFSVESVIEELAKTDLPRLFQPRARNFLEVEAIPKLGTGKTDLKGLRQLAADGFRA